jgi:hypothetical protein
LEPQATFFSENFDPHHNCNEGEFMKKLSFLAPLAVLCLPLAASAQEGAPKVEIFDGYS